MKRQHILYSILAVAFSIAFIYHVAAVLRPDSFPPSPAWRHILFIFLNLAGLLLSLKKWKWFWIPFALFTIQQLIAHGGRAYAWWTIYHRIDFVSLLIMVIMPVGASLLLCDFRAYLKNKS